MKALITGGSGFAGRHLTGLLHHEQVPVYDYSLRMGLDVRDYDQLRGNLAATQPDLIFHLAAQASPAESWSSPHRAVDVNVTGTLNLLEAVRNLGLDTRILLAGTSEQYGYELQPGPEVTEDSPCWPLTPYGASKLAAEQLGLVYARRYGLQVVCTRAFNHTGPGRPGWYADAVFARRIVRFERGQADAVPVGNLNAVRNWTDVRDVVAAYRAAIEQPPGSVLNVCSGRDATTGEVLGVLTALSTRQPVIVQVDDRLHRPSGTERWWPPSAKRLTAATGWHPTIPLEQSLADLLNNWRERL